jgi:hypothetical protein
MKMNELLIPITAWVNPKIIMPRERSHTKQSIDSVLCENPPASAFQVLGLQVSTTMSGYRVHFKYMQFITEEIEPGGSWPEASMGKW